MIRVDVLFDQFPFLSNFFPRHKIAEVRVSRINEELMRHIPEEGIFRWEDIIIVDRAGRELARVGSKPVEKRWYRPSTWMGEISFMETVAEAMVRLGDRAEEISFILQFSSTSVNVIGECVTKLTFFKLSKEFTIQQLIWMARVTSVV